MGLVKVVGGGPFQNLPGTVVDEVRDVIEVFGGEPSEVGAFCEVLAEHWSGPRKLDTSFRILLQEVVVCISKAR